MNGMILRTRAARRVALFCLCLLPLACRQGGNTPVTAEPISFSLSFSAGDSYHYDAILVDEYGYYVPSSRSKAVQRITGTGGTFAGMTGVVTVMDSTVLLRDTAAVVQEFRMAQSSTGDLYRYGFLAEMARIIGLPAPPPAWDRMAAFSQGLGSSWLAGYLDSARQKSVYGRFVGVTELCAAQVNGVQSVFPCYRIDIVGENLVYKFWISDLPSACPRIILEPGYGTKGAEYVLTEMRVHEW